MPRLFIGMLVPEDIKGPILDLQESLNKMPMDVKLVEPKNLHISLCFLGEVSSDKITQIERELDRVCQARRRFTVKIGNVVLIPNEDYIRVIALNVASSGDVLEEIRKEVVVAVGGDSHPAHLTLARVREVANKEFVRRSLSGAAVEKYFEVGSICLIRSFMKRSGPVYEIVHESILG